MVVFFFLLATCYQSLAKTPQKHAHTTLIDVCGKGGARDKVYLFKIWPNDLPKKPGSCAVLVVEARKKKKKKKTPSN